jgi:hypothetical protein
MAGIAELLNFWKVKVGLIREEIQKIDLYLLFEVQ